MTPLEFVKHLTIRKPDGTEEPFELTEFQREIWQRAEKG